MWEISYHISKTVTARVLKFYKHLDGSSAPFGNDNFFPQGGVSGVQCPSVNLGPLISRFFCSLTTSRQIYYSYVVHSCIPSPRLLSWSRVTVKCRSKLCEGQSLRHSTLRCCLDISGTMRDRKLKFYAHFDGAKYSFRVSKFFLLGGVLGAHRSLV